MLIPLRTELSHRKRPIATQVIIVINLLVYLAGQIGEASGKFENGEVLANFGQLDPEHFKLWQLITYQFLHDPHDVLHVIFNMLFLWVFGTAVENRFGHLGFPVFYVIAGAIAGVVHMVASGSPVIGASGAVAAVSGAFLALFPRAHIRVLLWFFIIGVYSIPAMWFIGFYFVIDLLSQTMNLLGRHGAPVAYAAHIGGYIFGFGLAMGLLALKIVPRGEFDMVRLWQQAHRRAKFRALTRHQVAGSWESASADTGTKLANARGKELIKEKKAEVEPYARESDAVLSLRSKLTAQVTAHDLPAAVDLYQQLCRLEPDAVLPEAQQLDIANQCSAQGEFELAAKAYEAMLTRYPHCSHCDEVRLMLGLIYSRHIRKPDRARELINSAHKNLSDAAQRGLADELLAELGS